MPWGVSCAMSSSMPSIMTMSTSMIVVTLVAISVVVSTSMSRLLLLLCLNLLHVKGSQVRQLSRGNDAFEGSYNGGACIVGADTVINFCHLVDIDQVRLANQDFVCERDLRMSLLIISTSVLAKSVKHCFCIHECDGPIHAEMIGNAGRLPNGPDNGNRIGHACGLHKNSIQRTSRFHLFADRVESSQQVTTHSAAHATVLHDNHLFSQAHCGILEQLVVNRNLTELVFDHCKLLASLVLQEVIQHRCLSRSKEACKNCDGNFALFRHAIGSLQGSGPRLISQITNDEYCATLAEECRRLLMLRYRRSTLWTQ
mmetsp:Transcript_57760/g.137494  ORF Transcript_57760/g.137494 Transcript_57760/m.137494 type:complete len:313 (+) Transcript_57760:1461-2399(+)